MRAGRATPTCSTPGSPRRCGRSRRSGWPDDTPELRAFYPTDVLSTARDILFLWVARMVMMGLRFPGEIPFADVYVHSVIQAPDGRRMSKSLGTGIDPLDLIERYGADAVRFGLLAMSSGPGRALQRGEDRPGPGAGQQAVERVAARAAARRLRRREPAPRPRTVEDRWILSRLQRAIEEVTGRIDGVRLLARRARALRLRLRRAVRLVPRARQAAPVRRLRREAHADVSATLLHVLGRDAGARPSADPVRDRGDLVLHARAPRA